MPFFTLQPIAPAANAVSSNGSSPASTLQKNPLTQGVSAGSELDNHASGDDAAPSFIDTLNSQLDQTVLPPSGQEGQEFAAVLTQEPGALQQSLADKQTPDEAVIVEGAWQQPVATVLDAQNNQAALSLQDIQSQRAVSVALSPQGAKQAQPQQAQLKQAALGTSTAVNQGGDTNLVSNQAEQAGKLVNQNVYRNIESGHQTDAAFTAASAVVNNPVNGVPGFSQKIQDNQTLPSKNTNSELTSQWLNSEQDSVIDVQTLHEKPLTLATKATLPLEPIIANVQTVTTPVLADTSDIALTAGTGFSKDINTTETHLAKTLGESSPINQALSAQAKIDVPPSHPQWSEQIAKRIGIMSSEKLQTVHIQLDPPELGSLDVKIKIQNDQMQVAFTSNHAQVRDALEAQSPRLKEMLEQQGINLSDVNVSDQPKQQAGNGNNDAQTAQEGAMSTMSNDADNQDQTTTVLESDSLVDYFA